MKTGAIKTRRAQEEVSSAIVTHFHCVLVQLNVGSAACCTYPVTGGTRVVEKSTLILRARS